MWEAIEGTLHCSSKEVSSGNTETKGLAAWLNSFLDFSLETHTCPQLPAVPRGPKAGQSPKFPTYSSRDTAALTHSALCTPEAHHSPEGRCRAPRDWQPGPHTESKCRHHLLGTRWPSTGVGGGHLGSVRERLEVSWMNCGREFLTEV